MRYYAMIDRERRGPFELNELADAGVRPETYVWCKGMKDWEKAEDVADICRFYRQHIFDLMHPSASPVESEMRQPGFQEEDPYESVPLRFRNIVRKSGEIPGAKLDSDPDITRPPAPTLMLSLFLTLFCFPITGLVAIYYSYKARSSWQESQRSESGNSGKLYNDKEREDLRKMAHDYDRQAKMWVGITFFLGLIFYAFVTHRFF